MKKPATTRLKVNPPLGCMPALQYLPPAQLRVDPSYQRSIEAGDSQALIRRIAQHWNWDLCQPLVIARRDDGALYVIDGQHRLEAARLRGDIQQLPAVVVAYASQADEAASFVHLNQQRRPLNKLDMFKAAVASGDPGAIAILEALGAAKLTIAPHTNSTAWAPGMISNISGIEQAWRVHGPRATAAALRILGAAWAGEVLRYAGTIFPGIVMVVAEEIKAGSFGEDRAEKFQTMLALRGQDRLRAAIIQATVDDPELVRTRAAEVVIRNAWAVADGRPPAVMPRATPRQASRPAPMPAARSPIRADVSFDRAGRAWCEQCDMLVSRGQAETCKGRYCSLRVLQSAAA